MRRPLLAALLILAAASAVADGRPGYFDFYLLALTWSPSYCADAHRPDPAQCDLKLPGFVVHGLWPEYERGYPQYCDSALPRLLPRSTISGIAEIIPSASAAQYEWEKHGLCSGLRPENYFSALRLAARRVVIPAEYVHPNAPIVTRAADVEAAFVTANPGMSESGIAATCDRDGVIEVRICLTKRLDFRRCVDVDRSACRQSSITLPTVD